MRILRVGDSFLTIPRIVKNSTFVTTTLNSVKMEPIGKSVICVKRVLITVATVVIHNSNVNVEIQLVFLTVSVILKV